MSDLLAPNKPGTKTFAELVKLVQDHYAPKPSEIQSFGVFRVTRVFQFSRVYVIIVHYLIPPCRKQRYSHQQKEFF